MFFVLRHGQTDWNAQLRLQGSTDIPLNNTGRIQARTAAGFLKTQPITRIIASPLSRAFETASIVAETLNLPVDIDPRIIERSFGVFEGLTLEEVVSHRAEMAAHMRPEADLDGKHYPSDAEPLTEVIDRVSEAVNEHRATGDTCLFVSHGIPFRAIARVFLGEMYSSPNASPVRYDQTDQTWAMTGLDPDNLPIHSSAYDAPTTMGRF
ncbi:MAG: histidine phosphatase family protein [Asticcacaulis sp.]